MVFSIGLVVASLVTTVIVIFLSALLLWAVAKYIFKVSDQYKVALIIATIVGVVNGLLGLIGMASLALMGVIGVINFVVSIVLSLYLVRTYYKLNWVKAAQVWIVWFILWLILGVILGFILMPIYLAIGLNVA